MDSKKISIKTVTIKDLWNVLRGCVIYIVVAAVAVTAFMYMRAKSDYRPVYSSTATLYLIGESDAEYSPNQWTMDYTLANVVIDDSIYLLTSRPVLDQVGEQVGIDNGYGALRGSVSIFNPDETRVLEVTARSSSPEMAKSIVDTVCSVGAKSINDVLGYDQIQIFEEGTYNTSPSNGVALSDYVKYGIIVGMVIYMIFLALFLFDNDIHNEEDIERYLGLSILGDIPNANAPKKKHAYAYKTHADAKAEGRKK